MHLRHDVYFAAEVGEGNNYRTKKCNSQNSIKWAWHRSQ